MFHDQIQRVIVTGTAPIDDGSWKAAQEGRILAALSILLGVKQVCARCAKDKWNSGEQYPDYTSKYSHCISPVVEAASTQDIPREHRFAVFWPGMPPFLLGHRRFGKRKLWAVWQRTWVCPAAAPRRSFGH
ncbi:MAG TPA: hypothetical protein VMD29_06015 [Terracidiphilus sp.]|nr:hypothetical protein [Terracidiphilus sp.]